MTRVIVADDHYGETLYVSEDHDEELFDLFCALIEAYQDGDSYQKAIERVIGS